MDVARGLPVGLAELAPGPELAAVLAPVDRSWVGADELHDLCQARQRLLAHVQAQLLADLCEAGRATGQPAGSLTRPLWTAAARAPALRSGGRPAPDPWQSARPGMFRCR